MQVGKNLAARGLDYALTGAAAASLIACERALLGDIGPWRERIYLAGGLAPSYLTGTLPEGAPAHVGTTDVDIIIGLAVADEAPETYRTLQNNPEKASFRQQEPSFQWAREVDGVIVLIEFLCKTDQVQPGRIFRPKGEYTGSRLGAFNVRGVQLARHDYIERQIRGERLDHAGQSAVTLRVANVLPYTVLKIFSFQDRHENKNAYDLIFTLLNQDAGPRAAGTAAVASSVSGHPRAPAIPAGQRRLVRRPGPGMGIAKKVPIGCGRAGTR